MSDVGKNIAKYRKEKGISINKLAELIGVSPSTVRDWEQGRDIRGEPYHKIAFALDISIGELMGLEKTEVLNHVMEIVKHIYELENLVNNLRKSL